MQQTGLNFPYWNQKFTTTELPSSDNQQDSSCLQDAQGGVYSCHICGKTFHGVRQRRNLKRHLMIHNGEKPFHCPFCPYKTNQKGNLKTHLLKGHRQQMNLMDVNVGESTDLMDVPLTETTDVFAIGNKGYRQHMNLINVNVDDSSYRMDPTLPETTNSFVIDNSG